MAFRILRAIGAVAVKLRFWFLRDFGACFSCAGAVGVDVLAFGELDVNALRIPAVERFRALMFGAPLVADHDYRVPVNHLRMGKIAVGIENDEQRLEAECLFEPAIGGLRILVADGARKPFGPIGVGHGGSSYLMAIGDAWQA